MSSVVVAIDGPSGSGKSSTSRGVAKRFGFAYLDTGAMYRACTVAMLDAGVHEPEDIVDLVRRTPVQVGLDPDNPQYALADRDVTEQIREPRIAAAVSTLATIPQVREILVARQRGIVDAASGGIVVEGRDITTVVAPDAGVRILLTADAQARIARRSAELGDQADPQAVTDQIIRRDEDDSTVSQFMTASDGVVTIDSTELSLDEVIDAICGLVEAANV